MTTAQVVIALVVGVRLIAPLLILRYPLPAILTCLVADAVDQTVFAAVLTGDLGWYQSYDKALDVYYLSFAFISTLTNWRDEGAFQIARLLFFWRLVGVALFEILHWRPLLLLFPNAFEYFFIAYEAIRTRWNPERLALVTLVGLAVGITLFVKLPQETWIHVLQLDFTDAIEGNPGFLAVVIAFLVVVAIGAVRLLRSAPDPDWGFTADVSHHLEPRPRLGLVNERLIDSILWEKLFFLSLSGMVIAHMVPELSVNNVRLAATVGLLVFLNAAVTEWWHNRRGTGWSTTGREFLVVLAVNLLLLALLPEWLLSAGLPEEDSGLLVVMISLMATMYDRGRDTRPPVDPPPRPFREAWAQWRAARAG
ncbi:hypothetical protein K8W59_12390 [Nocardioides rotundus]|uniref:hypothetical protein n=1 Tax=Nocardioides rotundus TaxID=1774216 RepID=UPI001CC1515B|nr:hypothetical protein [Nocardioides rotundus]UAL28661.1 hypothetical protein K8W59_12390 [Nocardioides rotundus]